MDVLFYIMLVLAVAFIVVNIVLSVIKKRRLNDVKKAEVQNEED